MDSIDEWHRLSLICHELDLDRVEELFLQRHVRNRIKRRVTYSVEFVITRRPVDDFQQGSLGVSDENLFQQIAVDVHQVVV